jgi:hypothetical protein
LKLSNCLFSLDSKRHASLPTSLNLNLIIDEKPLITKKMLFYVLLAALFVINIISSSVQSYQQQPSRFILSTRSFFDTETGERTALGEGSSHAEPNFRLDTQNCPVELAIYVHGVWATSQAAINQYDRVVDSTHRPNNSYLIPIVLFNWDSDTPFDIEGNGWRTAKGIADENGQLLANSILRLKNDCPQMGVRIIAHSLGTRVIFNALASLDASQEWNSSNFKIASMHLMGAAVDNEEVSKRASDTGDSTYDDHEVYGGAIERQVIKTYNLFSPEDNILQPQRSPYTYYPVYEKDNALGNNGAQSRISMPANYTDRNVQDQIPENPGDIDMTDANGDYGCDLPEWIFIPVFPYWILTCNIDSVGDNHMGYMGFRDASTQTLVDDGAIDIVVGDWRRN